MKERGQAEAVFGNQKIQELINDQSELLVFVGIQSRLSRQGGREVQVAVPTIIKDLPRLKSLVILCGQVIDTLSEAGFISQANAD